MACSACCSCASGSSRSSAARTTPGAPTATACAPSSPRPRAATSSTATATPWSPTGRRERGRAARATCAGARRAEVLARLAPKLAALPRAQLVKMAAPATASPARARRAGRERRPRGSTLPGRAPPRSSRACPCSRRTCAPIRRATSPPTSWAHVGAIQPRTRSPPTAARATRANETVGQGGLEREYEQLLQGHARRARVEVDAAGEPVGRADHLLAAPAAGATTCACRIDLHDPAGARDPPGRGRSRWPAPHGAAGVALDPHTGEVLALASYPDLRPGGLRHTASTSRPRAASTRTRTTRAEPGHRGASTRRAPPSSRSPPRPALEAGRTSPRTSRSTRPRRSRSTSSGFHELRGQPTAPINLPHGAARSRATRSSTSSGDRFFRATRAARCRTGAQASGSGTTPGIDLPGEAAGLVPDPGLEAAELRRARTSATSTASGSRATPSRSAVGQGYLQVTPAPDGRRPTRPSPTAARWSRPPWAARCSDPNGRVRAASSSPGRPTHELAIPPDYLDGDPRRASTMAANGPVGTSTRVFGNLPDGRTRWPARPAPPRTGGRAAGPLLVRGLRARTTTRRSWSRSWSSTRGTRGERRRAGRLPDVRGLPEVRPGPLRRRQRDGLAMTTIATRPAAPRAGFPDRLRAAVAGLDWVLLLRGGGHHGLRPLHGRARRPRPTPRRPALLLRPPDPLHRGRRGADARWPPASTSTGWPAGRGACGAACSARWPCVFVVGTARQGSNRWIDIGPFNLQPSEIGKVIIVDRPGRPGGRAHRATSGTPRFTLFLAGVVALPTAIVFLQPDLGHRAGLRGHPGRDPLPGRRALDALRGVRVDRWRS